MAGIPVAPLVLGLSLVACLLLPLSPLAPAGAETRDQKPTQASADALAARVHSAALRIHLLTEQLDQARLLVNSTSARMTSAAQQDQATVSRIASNRALLLEEAVRAYMQGGVAPDMTTAQMADVTISREYLTVASGNLSAVGEQLRAMDAALRNDQASLRVAQQNNLQAMAQLQSLRANALSIAASEQAQLDSLQTQLVAQTQAQAQAQAQAAAPAPARAASPVAAPQGAPVNNGLVAVIQQAIDPIVKPVTAIASTATGSGDGGGHAGGVWLQLRICESSDNYAENTGNGYYGAYQFSQATWSGLGYPGRPDQESPAMQDEAAMKLQAQSGWGQWPACSAALGLT